MSEYGSADEITTLRRAAALMRKRAEDALPRTRGLCEDWFEAECPELDHLRPPEAAHIASWHPTVALAVADWLDALARAIKYSGVAHHPEPLSITERGVEVARAYLGESR
jgi:hypothetical protein